MRRKQTGAIVFDMSTADTLKGLGDLFPTTTRDLRLERNPASIPYEKFRPGDLVFLVNREETWFVTKINNKLTSQHKFIEVLVTFPTGQRVYKRKYNFGERLWCESVVRNGRVCKTWEMLEIV